MFDLLNQWSKPMVFLAVLLTGVIRPAHGLFCLLSYFVGIHFAKLVRQVKGLLNHTRPVGGRKVSPGMVRSGSRRGGHGSVCGLCSVRHAPLLTCVSQPGPCVSRVVVQGSASRTSRTSRTAPRPSLTLCSHRAISRYIPSRPPSFPRLPSTHHFDRRAAPSPLPTPSSLRPLTTPSSTRPRSAFGARRRRRLFLRLARLERVVPFGRVVKVRVCVCV